MDSKRSNNNLIVAYFCAEFAVDDNLPIFSGGLGVLAGDLLKQASEDSIKIIGIGLLYKKGYFHQAISKDGSQIENPEPIHTASESLKRIFDNTQKPLIIELPIEGYKVKLKVWEYTRDGIKIYLLDSDHHSNSDQDKTITENLYPSDPRTRIKQEIVLGIGGEKILNVLNIDADIHHLNEGHSAFAIIELTSQIMKKNNSGFLKTLELARKKIVFTNHTLLPSGNDVFELELVKRLLSSYVSDLDINIDDLLQYGTTNNTLFTMTNFALNNAYQTNTVSDTHFAIAKNTWKKDNLISITNGVNKSTWQGKTISQVTNDSDNNINAKSLWLAHLSQKEQLIESLGLYIDYEINPGSLIITWARRIASYKNPQLIFENIERLKNILYNKTMPVFLIVAGKAHPDDNQAKNIIQNINNIITQHKLQDRVFFLPDYSLTLARLLVAGSDVWLNTPQPGMEACGTSGMKSALNGVLQCSINDGWMKELNWKNVGWLLDDSKVREDILDKIEKEITPLYYNRVNNLPNLWIQRMKQTIALVDDKYTTKRMLKEYIEKMYLPCINSMEEL